MNILKNKKVKMEVSHGIILKCFLCNIEENELELSHDIPKYLGGNDSMGRRWLCKNHHEEYEFKILYCCYLAMFGIRIKEDKEKLNYIPLMNKIKNLHEDKKIKCRKIAPAIKQEVFDNGRQ